MASTSIFKRIFDALRIAPAQAIRKSVDWFRKQVTSLKAMNAARNINSFKQVRSVNIGEMYFFHYDAKWKHILPVWDRFPLVIPFAINKDGFTGLNFHYLPYNLRIVLLDALITYKSDKNEHLDLTWKKIIAVSKSNMAQKAVHRYLTDHIKSEIRVVDSNDWTLALMMPVESFVDKTGKTITAAAAWK